MIDRRRMLVEAHALVQEWTDAADTSVNADDLATLMEMVLNALEKAYERGFKAAGGDDEKPAN